MKNVDLTQEAFDSFLDWLAPDREQAARIYETIRGRLIVFFDCRCCAASEDLADQTINRVVGLVPSFNGNYQGDPVPYFYRVAHYVFLDYYSTQAKRAGGTITDNLLEVPQVEPGHEKELQHVCLDQCLQQFPPDRRRLLIQYYRENKQAKIDHRKWLAEQLGGDSAQLSVWASFP